MNTEQKFQRLVELGYNESWLKMVADPKFSHIRFSYDDLLLLEDQIGKVVKVETMYANKTAVVSYKVNRISVGVVAASFFVDGYLIPSITKKSISNFRENGTFLRDCKNFKN